MLNLLSTSIVLFACFANFRHTTLYKTYTMLHRGTLLRLQVGARARLWIYVSILTWAIAAGTEMMIGHHLSTTMSLINCAVDIVILKTRSFDDLDAFGSGAKKKLKAIGTKVKSALTPSNSGRSLAPMPV